MMSDDQIAVLFERWLAGDPKTPQYILATAFFELVEQYIADCETNTDKEA